jgi:isopentenyldiphosphate isomerase
MLQLILISVLMLLHLQSSMSLTLHTNLNRVPTIIKYDVDGFDLQVEYGQCNIKIVNTNQNIDSVVCSGPVHEFQEVPLLNLAMTAYSNRYDCSKRYFSIDFFGVKYMEEEDMNDVHSVYNINGSIKKSRGAWDGLRQGDTALIEEELVDWISIDGYTIAPLPRGLVMKHNLLHKGMGVLIFDPSGQIFVHKRSSLKSKFPSMLDMFIGGVCATGEDSSVTLLRELKEEVGLDFVSTQKPRIVSDAKKTNKGDSFLKELGSNTDKAAYTSFKNAVLEEIFEIKIQDQSHDAFTNVSHDEIGPSIVYLGQTTIETDYNNCVVDVFSALCTDEMSKKIHFFDGECEWGKFMTPKSLSSLLNDKKEDFVPDGLQVWNALQDLSKTRL